ncbi:MAG: helix-turn-helix domain-containing protein, partial [Bacteroidetes bacterium]|nr:helix-turn-helix domain-containing protein [Bacteroidota bacterium]
MIDPEKRKAIYQLHIHGIPVRSITRQMQVDRNTVRKIIEQKGETPESARSDKINLDSELLVQLYARCDGFVQRIHEILEEKYGVKIGYSTLTAKIRELELGKPQDQRCDRREDVPGAEMQHDTSDYKVKLGEKHVKVVASMVYYRYCKIRYLKFYRVFNRYLMKCFFHEALMFWKFCAGLCVIDNTSLARWYGTGKNAVIVPEMVQFSKQYGFEFICHEKGHANRKAGNERSFYTVETNFFPGRTFMDLSDLNRQAFEWATVRMNNRPVAKTGLIPAKAFEYEQTFLKKVPTFIMPPYLEFNRTIDQYGYIPFDANYYWVPGLKRHDVKVLRFPADLKIY